MRSKWLWVALLFFIASSPHFAQTTFPTNGANDPQVTHYVFINANIQVTPNELVANGILEINDGKVVAVKKNGAKYDTTAIVVDLGNKYIYPSFIDIYSDYGLPKHSQKKEKGEKRQK